MQTQAVAASELKRLGRHNATLQVVESLVKEPHCFPEFAKSLLNKGQICIGRFSFQERLSLITVRPCESNSLSINL